MSFGLGWRSPGGSSAPAARLAEPLALGCCYLLDFGATPANGLGATVVNGGTTPADNGAIASVTDALGGALTLAGSGTSVVYSTTHAIATVGGGSAPVAILTGSGSLVSSSSPIFTSVNGADAPVYGGAWGTRPWTIRALVNQVAASSFLSAGLLVGVSGHANLALNLGGAGFATNGLWPGVGNGSNGTSLVGSSNYATTARALNSGFYSYTFTYDGTNVRSYIDGMLAGEAIGTDGVAASPTLTSGSIPDPGFGVAPYAPGATWGTVYLARLELYRAQLDAYAIAYLDGGLRRVYPSAFNR